MPEYLTKEEIRQWRSSLEKITLEEYAARLGKVIQGEKETNDMIDKVMVRTINSLNDTSEYQLPNERLQTLTLKSMFETKSSITAKKPQEKETTAVSEKAEKTEVKEVKPKTEKNIKTEKAPAVEEKEIKTETAEVNTPVEVTFKKPLIPREQMIFDLLVKNQGSIVYAKDMATLLELPRDYVYKYIKNLRQKINEDVIVNADNGGYVFKV